MTSSRVKSVRRFGAMGTVALVVAGVLSALVGVDAATAQTAVSTAPAVADGTSASSEGAAAAIASRFGHSVIVDSLTTSTTETTALPDGSFQLVSSSIPVRVHQSQGWVPIDATLAVGSDGFLAPRATEVPVKFSAGGAGALARIRTSTGAWLDEASPFGALPAPKLSGASATYAEVLPGVDLLLTATPIGMSEVLVIKTAKAALNPKLASIDFSVSGATVKTTAAGLSTAKASDGSSLVATTPTWWDSSGSGDAAGPDGNGVPIPVSRVSSATSSALDVLSTLGGRSVNYPIYVDPDWTGGQNSFWYIDQAYPTTSYLNGANAGGEQRVGYITAAYSPDSKNHLARSFWAMNTAGVAGKQVSAAHFNVVEDWAFNCTASPVQLWWAAAVTPGSTWNQTTGNPYLQVLDTVSTAHRAGGAGACATASVGFNALAGAQAAASANASSLTLALRAQSESSNSGWKRFQQAATLTITYNSIPGAPGSPQYTSPTRSCATTSATATSLDGTQPITLQATANDADAGQNLTTTFSIAGVSPTSFSWSKASPAQAAGAVSVVVPAATMTTGLYSWHAQTNDGAGGVSANSTECYFRIVTASPVIPTVSVTSTGGAVVGHPITVQFGSSATDGVAVFAYWWVDGSATTPPTPPVLTPITPGGAVPASGTASGPVRFVGRDTGSFNATGVTVAPIDTTSTLWVASYNDAGRVSVNSGGTYTAAALHVSATADTTGVSNTVGHIWDSQAITSSATSVPDLNTTTGTSGSTVRQALGSPLNLIDGDFEGIPTTLLNYTTASSGSMTVNGEAIDTKNSFTVSAWLYPSASSSTTVSHVAVSEIGTGGAAFTLGTGVNGVATFCRTSQVNQSQACAVGTAIPYGDWTLLTGVWDSTNQSLRILRNGNISSADGVASQPVPANDTSATSWLCVGGSCSYTTGFVTTSPWDGQIFRPAVFPGVVSGAQLNNLYNVLSPNDEPPVDQSIGSVVNTTCNELITPQNMYDYNPNFGLLTSWTPDIGSDVAKAIAWNGVGCRWQNQTSNDLIDVSVASIVDRGTMVQLQDAAATGTAVAGYGDSAYFKMTGDVGELQIFSGSYWITLKSDWFWAASDADPLPADILAHLP